MLGVEEEGMLRVEEEGMLGVEDGTLGLSIQSALCAIGWVGCTIHACLLVQHVVWRGNRRKAHATCGAHGGKIGRGCGWAMPGERIRGGCTPRAWRRGWWTLRAGRRRGWWTLTAWGRG